MVRGVTPQVDAVEMLRAAGLRVTGARLAALDALAGGGHLSADEVVTEVRERLGVHPGRVRRAPRPGGGRLGPPGRARRLTGPLRGPCRRQPPPRRLPQLRCHRRRRLRRRRRALPGTGRARRLRHRRGRGHLLGAVSCLPGPAIRPVPTYGGLRMTDARSHLTTRQGHPVYDNQNQRTVGSRGPATMENYRFLERIPERVVHARGFVAHGSFEAYGTIGDQPAATYTRAKLFGDKGKRTPVTIRFSTVIGGRDSADDGGEPVS